MKKLNGYAVPAGVVIMLIMTIINLYFGSADKAVANVESNVVRVEEKVTVIDNRSNENKTEIAVLKAQYNSIDQNLIDIKTIVKGNK